MTDNESFKLMGFLRSLTQTRYKFVDPLASKLIRESIDTQPNATYLLIHRSITLEMALEAANGRVKELEQQLNIASSEPSHQEFLNTSMKDWSLNLEDKSKIPMTAKNKKPYLSFEDIAIKFLAKHMVKIWAIIFSLSGLAVYFKAHAASVLG